MRLPPATTAAPLMEHFPAVDAQVSPDEMLHETATACS
jgi:hypothetical protein